jgi:hypothetical protein
MGFRIERVHQGRADDGLGICIAEQFEPGRIRIDDDAFLHEGNGIGRASHERLELVAILPRRTEGAVQCTCLAMCFELACDDCAQAGGRSQSHHIPRALLHGCGDDVLVHLIAGDEHRDARLGLSAHLHDLRRVGRVRTDEGDQHVRVRVLERLRQIRKLADPGAANRLAGIAQSAIDRFNVVLMAGQDDHGYGGLVSQANLPIVARSMTTRTEPTSSAAWMTCRLAHGCDRSFRRRARDLPDELGDEITR